MLRVLAAAPGLLLPTPPTPLRQPGHSLKPNTITPGAFPSTTCSLGKPFTPPLRRPLSSLTHDEESLAPLIRFVAITHGHRGCYRTWLILYYPKRYNTYKTASYIHLYIRKTGSVLKRVFITVCYFSTLYRVFK